MQLVSHGPCIFLCSFRAPKTTASSNVYIAVCNSRIEPHAPHRQTGRQTETARQRDKEAERQRDRQTVRQTDSQTMPMWYFSPYGKTAAGGGRVIPQTFGVVAAGVFCTRSSHAFSPPWHQSEPAMVKWGLWWDASRYCAAVALASAEVVAQRYLVDARALEGACQWGSRRQARSGNWRGSKCRRGWSCRS